MTDDSSRQPTRVSSLREDGKAHGRIAIGLVDNDPYALALLRPQIERLDPRFRVVWVSSTGVKAVHHCLFTAPSPDVLVVDMGLSDMPGTRVCEELRERGCMVGFVGITALPTANWAQRLASCGGQALVAKDDIRNRLPSAILAAASGQGYDGYHGARMDGEGSAIRFPSVREAVDSFACSERNHADAGSSSMALDGNGPSAGCHTASNPLSPRQRQVLAAYASGMSTKAIARSLHTSGATVYVHLHDAIERLGAGNKIEAIAIARRNHWIDVGE